MFFIATWDALEHHTKIPTGLNKLLDYTAQSTVIRSAVPHSKFQTALFRYQRYVKLYIMSQYELKSVTDLTLTLFVQTMF